MNWRNQSILKILSLFSGIGAFEKAMERLGIQYELVGFSEIDSYAIKSYCIIHDIPESKNLGDITKIDTREIEDFDLLTWGFPCQDISLNGKMRGIEKETRSGLYYYGYNILKAKLPKISIIENVKNLASKRFKKKFESILNDIEKLGYTNYWKIMNAKDFGIPQNRERLFIISIRNDVYKNKFNFPEPIKLKIKLKDVLEDEVNIKYYLTREKLEKMLVEDNYKNICENINVEPYILIRENTKKGYAKAIEGDSINYSYPNSMVKRGRVGKQVSQTILTSPTMGTLVRIEKLINKDNNKRIVIRKMNVDSKELDIGIRRLTPKECWRLMGFEDEDFEKIKSIKISDSQAYKLAGNSIVVNVLEAIFYKLFCNENIERCGVRNSNKETEN